MNVEAIFQAMGRNQVSFILIGGMNFLLQHQPVLTFDVDLWVEDSDENLHRLNLALRELGAQWGPKESAWAPIPESTAWLKQQNVFCLTTNHGALDIFRSVRGLESFSVCLARSKRAHLAGGEPYQSLSDQDMLACQLALPEAERRLDRVRYFQNLLS